VVLLIASTEVKFTSIRNLYDMPKPWIATLFLRIADTIEDAYQPPTLPPGHFVAVSHDMRSDYGSLHATIVLEALTILPKTRAIDCSLDRYIRRTAS
jgi:hypothetical protein